MRIFQAIPLQEKIEIKLDVTASHYVSNVLRAKIKEEITLFNGEGGEYHGVIEHIDKKHVTVKLNQFDPREAESPLELYLAQGISRGEKMDFTIQKAVELGVKKIIPLFTERCNVKLDAEKKEKRLQHWRSIIVSACEQCGRNRLPDIQLPQTFFSWVKEAEADQKFVLSPGAHSRLVEAKIDKKSRVLLLIGPEGGLTENEKVEAENRGFSPLALGPRILRTETAGVAALALFQGFFGDLS